MKDKEYSGYRGVGIRMKDPTAPEMQFATPTLHVSGELTEGLHMFDKAHLVMLSEEGIISRDHARRCLQALVDMENRGIEKVREETGSGIHAGEVYLIRKLGMDVGGRIHAGRSSADLTFVSTQIRLRLEILDTMDAVNRYREAVLALAKSHTEIVMPNYTHGQHAQPTTFGHYLHSFACTSERDFVLLDRVYVNNNVSTAGVVAGTASNFHTNRERTAELLGFDSVSANTKDSYYLREYLAWQFSSALAIITATLGRMADDLLGWCGQEYQMVRIADSYCDTSSIMAHKRNPLSLEYIQHVRDMVGGRVPTTYDLNSVLFASKDTKNALTLMCGILGTLEVAKGIMLDSVSGNWGQIPDLAGVLVLERGFSWRVAHQVVAIMVRLAEEQGLGPADVTAELLDSAAVKYTGKPAGLPLETIKSALDPTACVHNRVVTGSPGPAEVKRQLEVSSKLLDKDRKSVKARREKLAYGERKLAEAVRKIIL